MNERREGSQAETVVAGSHRLLAPGTPSGLRGDFEQMFSYISASAGYYSTVRSHHGCRATAVVAEPGSVSSDCVDMLHQFSSFLPFLDFLRRAALRFE